VISPILRLYFGSCDETRALLSDHLEGELTGRRQRRVLRHLVRCERCRALLAALARTVEQLHSLGRADAGGGISVADSVLERIRAAPR
jgi:predicted anti-sigma-YlaC factor YlaD